MLAVGGSALLAEAEDSEGAIVRGAIVGETAGMTAAGRCLGLI